MAVLDMYFGQANKPTMKMENTHHDCMHILLVHRVLCNFESQVGEPAALVVSAAGSACTRDDGSGLWRCGALAAQCLAMRFIDAYTMGQAKAGLKSQCPPTASDPTTAHFSAALRVAVPPSCSHVAVESFRAGGLERKQVACWYTG